jgi:hypothetical protein
MKTATTGAERHGEGSVDKECRIAGTSGRNVVALSLSEISVPRCLSGEIKRRERHG